MSHCTNLGFSLEVAFFSDKSKCPIFLEETPHWVDLFTYMWSINFPNPCSFASAFHWVTNGNGVTIHPMASFPSHPHRFQILSGSQLISAVNTPRCSEDTQPSAIGPSLYYQTYLLLHPVFQLHPTEPTIQSLPWPLSYSMFLLLPQPSLLFLAW